MKVKSLAHLAILFVPCTYCMLILSPTTPLVGESHATCCYKHVFLFPVSLRIHVTDNGSGRSKQGKI